MNDLTKAKEIDDLIKLVEAQIVLYVSQATPKGTPHRRNEWYALINAGRIGAWAAAKRFNPTLGIKFETFAQKHIWGAIIDSIRNESGNRKKLRIGWIPTINQSDFESESGRQRFFEYVIRHITDRSPELRRDWFKDVCKCLPDKHALVVTLYYLEEKTMLQVSEEMNLSESRVSQIHTQAIEILYDRYKDDAP